MCFLYSSLQFNKSTPRVSFQLYFLWTLLLLSPLGSTRHFFSNEWLKKSSLYTCTGLRLMFFHIAIFFFFFCFLSWKHLLRISGTFFVFKMARPSGRKRTHNRKIWLLIPEESAMQNDYNGSRGFKHDCGFFILADVSATINGFW